jgi:hypothetical protein
MSLEDTRAERVAQGLPPTVEDPAVLARVAGLVLGVDHPSKQEALGDQSEGLSTLRLTSPPSPGTTPAAASKENDYGKRT